MYRTGMPITTSIKDHAFPPVNIAHATVNQRPASTNVKNCMKPGTKELGNVASRYNLLAAHRTIKTDMSIRETGLFLGVLVEDAVAEPFESVMYVPHVFLIVTKHYSSFVHMATRYQADKAVISCRGDIAAGECPLWAEVVAHQSLDLECPSRVHFHRTVPISGRQLWVVSRPFTNSGHKLYA